MTARYGGDLRAFEQAINFARDELIAARAGDARPGVRLALAEQRALLAALESYASELAQLGHRMPYRLHNELVLYRTMLDPRHHEA